MVGPRHVRRVGLAVLAAAGLLVVDANSASAQETGRVQGEVIDGSTQEPLSGAQVIIEGTDLGTLANSDGRFMIMNVPVGTHTIRAQLIGYGQDSREVTVRSGELTTVEFELGQSAIGLDEIVVTGTAGEETRRSIGNAVTQIQASDLAEAAPITNVQEMLTARSPGLTLLSNSGQAGASSRIRIRGAGSLSGGLEPVIYVDGIRVSASTEGGSGVSNGTVQGTNPLDAIDPDDIESIEVIKGPAAATLYGADAAGGVVQIITKSGSTGQDVRWTADMEYGQTDWHLDTPTNYWLCTQDQVDDPDNYPGCADVSAGTLLTDKPLERTYECRYTDECQPNPLRTGQNRSLGLSASGGGENFTYYLSLDRTEEEGVFYNNFSRRTAGRANFGFTPNDELDITANVSYARRHVKMPLNNNASNGILRTAFRGLTKGPAARYEPGWYGFSPELSNTYDNQTRSERLGLGLTARYNPFDWFSNKLTLGLDKQDRTNRNFRRIDETGLAPWGPTAAEGAVYRRLPTTHVWTVDYSGTVDTDLTPDVSSATSAGMQLNARQYSWYYVVGEGLVANKLNLTGSAAETRASQTYQEQTSLGFFVQERVGWKNRLFGTAAVRVDDNSAFGDQFTVVVYPKASLSYLISEEDFFEVDGVDELKLRTAWGRAGNAPAPFSADRTLSPQITTAADAPVNYISFDDYGNPDLKAETGQEIEVGLDASFLNGRVATEFTYYNQRTKDALVSIPDPPSSGYSGSHLVNIGEIANSGLELLVTTTPVAMEDVVWDATLSFATNHNELVSFNGARDEIVFGAFANVQKHAEGYALGGLWATDVKRDGNGDPILDDNGNVIVNDTSEYMGPMLPTREVGLTSTLTLFQDLQLFAHLDYKGGNYQWCAMCSIRNRFNRNTLQVNDPEADPIQRKIWTSRQTKTHIAAADFIKLRELSATYTLPQEWVGGLGVSRAALTIAGRNLWLWTKEYEDKTDFVDPEVSFYSQSSFTQVDYASAPMMRRLTASLRLSF